MTGRRKGTRMKMRIRKNTKRKMRIAKARTTGARKAGKTKRRVITMMITERGQNTCKKKKSTRKRRKPMTRRNDEKEKEKAEESARWEGECPGRPTTEGRHARHRTPISEPLRDAIKRDTKEG